MTVWLEPDPTLDATGMQDLRKGLLNQGLALVTR